MAEDDWGGDDVPPSRPPRSGPRSGGPRSEDPRSGRPPRRGPSDSMAGPGDRPRSRRGALNLEPPPSDPRRPRSNSRRSEGTLFDDQPYEPRSYESRSGRPSGPPQDEPEMRDPRREPPRDISRDGSDGNDDSYVDYQPLEGPPSDEGATPPAPEADNREPDSDRPAAPSSAIDEPLFPNEPTASRGSTPVDKGYDDYDDYDDELDGDRYDRP